MQAARWLIRCLAVTVIGFSASRSLAQTQVRVPAFLPSYWGLHFPNSFPPGSPYAIKVGGVPVSIGDASNGMCGGMAFAVRDYYESGLPVPSGFQAPARGPLFSYLSKRLFDSFELPAGPAKYQHLMNPTLPDHETILSQWGFAPHGRAWIMIREEWPLIKAELDRGVLSPLGLIRVKTLDVSQMGKNHQVLAYGYDLNGDDLVLYVYDPNHPDDNSIKLSLSLRDPTHTTPVTYSADSDPVFAFFHVNYTPDAPPLLQDEEFVGDWDGDGRDNHAARRDNCVFMDTNFRGGPEIQQCYGSGAGEDQYLIGDWDGDGRDNLAVRRGNCVLMDTNFDGVHDIEQCYGSGAGEDQYLVGDWDGDGRDNLAVRRGNCVLMDTNFDGIHDIEQCYGSGAGEDQYLVGDWDGDGRDNLAVRRGNCLLMDTNFDGVHDIQQCYGGGLAEGAYLSGDWNGDGVDNVAVRRGNCFLMDTNRDSFHDLEQCYSLPHTP